MPNYIMMIGNERLYFLKHPTCRFFLGTRKTLELPISARPPKKRSTPEEMLDQIPFFHPEEGEQLLRHFCFEDIRRRFALGFLRAPFSDRPSWRKSGRFPYVADDHLVLHYVWAQGRNLGNEGRSRPFSPLQYTHIYIYKYYKERQGKRGARFCICLACF